MGMSDRSTNCLVNRPHADILQKFVGCLNTAQTGVMACTFHSLGIVNIGVGKSYDNNGTSKTIRKIDAFT